MATALNHLAGNDTTLIRDGVDRWLDQGVAPTVPGTVHIFRPGIRIRMINLI